MIFKYLIFSLLIQNVYSQNSSNITTTSAAPNRTITTTTATTTTSTTTTTSRPTTTTVITTTTTLAPISITTTTTTMVSTTTNVSLPTNNTIPSCTLTPSNYTCKICIGNHCRMFTESEQAAYRGIIITISILTMLVTSSCVIYYVFFEYPKKYKKIGEVELNDVIMFSVSDSDDDEYAKNNSGVDV